MKFSELPQKLKILMQLVRSLCVICSENIDSKTGSTIDYKNLPIFHWLYAVFLILTWQITYFKFAWRPSDTSHECRWPKAAYWNARVVCNCMEWLKTMHICLQGARVLNSALWLWEHKAVLCVQKTFFAFQRTAFTKQKAVSFAAVYKIGHIIDGNAGLRNSDR